MVLKFQFNFDSSLKLLLGLDGSVLCDPTALESAYADSHLNFAANGAGLIQLRISSRASGIDAARLPPLIAQARPALTHLSAALKGLLPRMPIAEKLPVF